MCCFPFTPFLDLIQDYDHRAWMITKTTTEIQRQNPHAEKSYSPKFQDGYPKNSQYLKPEIYILTKVDIHFLGDIPKCPNFGGLVRINTTVNHAPRGHMRRRRGTGIRPIDLATGVDWSRLEWSQKKTHKKKHTPAKSNIDTKNGGLENVYISFQAWLFDLFWKSISYLDFGLTANTSENLPSSDQNCPAKKPSYSSNNGVGVWLECTVH